MKDETKKAEQKAQAPGSRVQAAPTMPTPPQ